MILFRKAIRSMLGNKRSYLACIWLISIGILFYVAMGITVQSLKSSRDAYFKEYRLADIFADVSAIPKSAEEKLLKIEGIADVSLRHVEDSRVILPDNDKIITLRVISLDDTEENPINAVKRTGNGFYAGNDILIADSFLKAHGLDIGDSIDIIVAGKQTTFNICGTGGSPEYVYTIRGGKEVLPDAASFNIAYLDSTAMGNLLGAPNIYNSVSFMLEDGYSFDNVKTLLEDELERFGLKQLTEQKFQPSTSMLNSEIDSDESMSTSIPFAFIGMAVIILYLMLKRVIEQDRTQIGTLKAFGYSNGKIIRHYLFYGFLTGLMGAIAGMAGGYFLSGFISSYMSMFFNMPMISKSGDISLLAKGFAIGIFGGLLGAFMGARKVIALIPSEAMRAEAPKETKHDVLKYLPFIKIFLNSGGNMAIRNIARNKFRSAFIVLGITFSFGILSFIGSFPNMIDDMMLNQFTKVQIYDMKINYKTPVSYVSGVEDATAIKGVTRAEGLLEIPVEFKHNHNKKAMIITGIEKNSDLYKIYDDERKASLTPSQTGVILSSTIAKNLDAKRGDILLVHSQLLKDDIKVIVSDIVQQSLGSSCYMEINALAELFNLSQSITASIIKTDDLKYIKQFLKDGKNIELIEDKSETIASYGEMLGMVSYMLSIYFIVGIAVAVAIIYNTATISLSERKREFATLRVLGMQVKQVSAIMSFEYWVLSVFGMAFGIPFTMALKRAMAAAIDMDAFAFPTYTTLSAFLVGFAGCIAAVFISNQASRKKIKTFDMVEVLKERE